MPAITSGWRSAQRAKALTSFSKASAFAVVQRSKIQTKRMRGPSELLPHTEARLATNGAGSVSNELMQDIQLVTDWLLQRTREGRRPCVDVTPGTTAMSAVLACAAQRAGVEILTVCHTPHPTLNLMFGTERYLIIRPQHLHAE